MPGPEFDKFKKAAYVAHVESGMTRIEASKATGVDRTTVSRHIRNDENFARAVSEAEMARVPEVEAALLKACVEDRNVTAIMFYLQNRDPERWRDMRGGGKPAEGGGAEVPELTDEELNEALKRVRTA